MQRKSSHVFSREIDTALERSPRVRRSAIALILSAGLHLCVLRLWITRETPSPPPSPTPAQSLVWTDVVSLPTPPPAPPSPSPAAVQKPRARPPTPPRAPSVPTEVASAPSIDLTPREIDLVPSDTPPGERPTEPARGRTLTPSDLPSSEELLADEQARVEARVSGWLKSGLAQARVTGGLPDPEYGQLGRSLRAATDDVPKFIDTDSAREVLGALKESWLAGAERYGKTGAPYAEPEGRLEALERPRVLLDSATQGSRDAVALMSFLAAGARLQEFADGRAGLELYALVELRQSSAGALEVVTLVRPSGLQPFDAWVQERARTVALEFSLDGGTRTRPLRSVWRFDGILKFRRTLKASELDGRAVLGMISMAALSTLANLDFSQLDSNRERAEDHRLRAPRMPGLTGRFDETTGALDVVDFTNPTYDCTVRLIEAD